MAGRSYFRVFGCQIRRTEPVGTALRSAKRRRLQHNALMSSQRIVPLQQIPTLRELYQRTTIAARPAAGKEARYPFSSALLDRVSVQ